MRVLMTSTSYPRNAGDWRGTFIRDMAAALARDCNVDLRLWAPPGELPPRVETATTAAESNWLASLLDAGGIAHLLRHPRLRALSAPLTLLHRLRATFRREEADIYHVNWLQCALALPSNGIPALVTILGNDFKLLSLPLMRTLLRRALRGRRAALCPNAGWMRAPLETAFGDVAQVIPVEFGIDPQWFAVHRAPQHATPLWLVVSRLTANKLGPLFDWSEVPFRGQARQLHLFGPMQESIQVPDWINYHGAATAVQLAEWFARASGLVTLSRHSEGLPQVMLEAMAAGLPVIASRLPAHASLISEGETGALCDSASAYSRALHGLEEPATNRRIGDGARRHVVARFGTWDDCARRYLDVYRLLLQSDARG